MSERENDGEEEEVKKRGFARDEKKKRGEVKKRGGSYQKNKRQMIPRLE